MTRWRTRHRGSHAERGAAAVEFAIVLVVLLLIVFAIIDFGRLLFASQSMKAASREGARTAAVRACWSTNTGNTTCTTASSALVLAVTRGAGNTAAALAGGNLLVTGTGGTNGRTVGGTGNAAALTQADSASNVQLCTTSGASVTVEASTPFRWFTPVGIFSSNVNSVSASTTMRCE